MVALGQRLRPILDLIYTLCGWIGAVFLLLILCIIVVQMVARWTGFTVPGSTDYAGYCMAAASFFALAYALNHGAHIRVTLFLLRLGKYRRWGEIWCFGVGTVLACYFSYYAIKATYWSEKLNDISQGQDATPLWIPQLSMSIGTVVLALALFDHFLRLIFGGLDAVGEAVSKDRSE